MNNDPVNRPAHYCSHPSKVECIVITREMNFNVGNAFKYLYRCDQKENFMQDVKKAIWYIEDEIKRREKLRWKFMREDPFYRPMLDGPPEIKAILENERRCHGHLCWALERLYSAHVLGRSVEHTLQHALAACRMILKTAT